MSFDEQPDYDMHGACAAEIHRIKRMNEDLSVLVLRLARALNIPGGNTVLARQAMEYLQREKRFGSPLRDVHIGDQQ